MISLDFELHWGQPEVGLGDARVRSRLLGAREVIPLMLALFEEFDIAVTWATVGRLFARSASEIEEVRPRLAPRYVDPRFAPPGLRVGSGEADDPFHYAPSLIARIRQTPRQEIGTHTFSHFYCLEAGQTKMDFAADLAAACEIARRSDVVLRSIAFPRNQENPAYRSVLIESGLSAYRGNPAGVWRAVNSVRSRSITRRAVRLVDGFVQWTAREGIGWDEVIERDGLANVRATSFLRPFDARLGPAEALRFRRIAATLERAARTRRIVHLWWHPHNFAKQPAQNLAFLRRILEAFSRCRAMHGMMSLNMADVAAMARDVTRSPAPARHSTVV